MAPATHFASLQRDYGQAKARCSRSMAGNAVTSRRRKGTTGCTHAISATSLQSIDNPEKHGDFLAKPIATDPRPVGCHISLSLGLLRLLLAWNSNGRSEPSTRLELLAGLLKSGRAKLAHPSSGHTSAHPSAKALDAVTTPSFGGALLSPPRTIVATTAVSRAVTTASVSRAVATTAISRAVSRALVSRANGHTTRSQCNLGERRSRSEEKGSDRRGCESVGSHP